MTDIEVKRKELETAKRIREMGSDGHCAICDGVSCDEDNCPFVVICQSGIGSELTPEVVCRFISTRESELAALEETPRDGVCQKCLGEGFYYTKGATTMEAVKRTCECQTGAYSKPRLYIGKDGKPEYIMPIGPTLDDFALALIQGGFYQDLEADEETHAMPAECLFNAAASLKAESDRRRVI